MRTEGSKITVANFRSGLFMFQTQKAEQYDKTTVAASATVTRLCYQQYLKYPGFPSTPMVQRR